MLLLALGGALAVLCHQGFLPHQVHFSNDNPLGWLKDSSARLPGTFFGKWENLYWLGGVDASSSPSFSSLLQAVCSPEMYSRIFMPLSMFFLGAGAWLFFRELGFAPGVCVVGGLGAGLNMHFFSNACWGLGVWSLSAAMIFVTLAVIVSPAIRPLWVKGAIAGLSAGMVVMEGYDTGAILSLYAGVFIVFYFLALSPNPVREVPKTIAVGSVMVFFALMIASSTLYTLIEISFKGVAKVGESAAEKQARWEFTTQWSFPKLETLRLVIPGVFGYRMLEFITETNKASSYWGKIAEDPHVDELESGSPETRAQAAASLGLPPAAQNDMASDKMAVRENIVDQVKAQVQRRHIGSGDYTGVLVCLLAFFGLCNSCRTLASPYSQHERQAVWFWGGAALFSLVAAWGRYAPLYQFSYHLPFINNIRNPIKFLHPLNICLIILSGYGLEALHRRYLRGAVQAIGSLPKYLLRWWRKTSGFDKQWAIGSLVVLLASIAGLLILSASKGDLVHYLTHNGFSEEVAPQMAAFCVQEVALFILFYAASAGVVIGILSGAWSGSRAPWAWVFLSAIMILDLGRADAPWIRYFDYTKKYSMNPVIDFLRHDPWEHRVVARRSPTVAAYDLTANGNFGALCHFWLENDYLANDIESVEIDQAPRMPELDKNYLGVFSPRSPQDLASPARLWRLTNTRYILADATVTAALNQRAEPSNSFRNVMLMDLVNKPGVTLPEDAGDLTVQPNGNGPIALIEFTRALPRAKLYSDWQMTDDKTTLDKLGSPEFDPTTTVLVATNTPVSQTPAQPGANPGAITIVSYRPKDVQLRADAKTPAVLLLNDRTGDHWNVWVDQKPASILRCNYIMRGVYVPRGEHTIEFRFQPPLVWLYVSVSAFAVGVLLFGYVIQSTVNPSMKRVPARR